MKGKFYSDYESLVFNYINKYIDNKTVAEDLCHDTYLDFLLNFENTDMPDEEYARRWLMKTAKNNTLNYLGKAATRYEIYDGEYEEEPMCELFPEEDIQRALVYENVEKLSGIYYDVIVGRLNDVSFEAMVESTGKSKHALECIYTRALKKLKDYVLESIKNI